MSTPPRVKVLEILLAGYKTQLKQRLIALRAALARKKFFDSVSDRVKVEPNILYLQKMHPLSTAGAPRLGFSRAIGA
jgi:hypothetical protein